MVQTINIVVLVFLFCFSDIISAIQPGRDLAESIPEQGEYPLQARRLAQQVVARNAETLYTRLQTDIAEYLRLAERGIYEPVIFGELSYLDTKRPRTAEERISFVTADTSNLDETDNNLEVGMRSRVSSGGEIEISHRFVKTSSNIVLASSNGNRDIEYAGLLTLNFKQPLLRGRGRNIIETDLQVAELERDVTLVQYQQQVLKVAEDAIKAYWQLYFAREVLQIRKTALANAQKVSDDVNLLVKRGRSPHTEWLETRIAIANREAEQARALQSLVESEANIKTLLNLSGDTYAHLNFTAVQAPTPHPEKGLSIDKRYTQALDAWPAYRIAKLRKRQQTLRLKYANNQRLPKLDLLLGYNHNSLNYNGREALDDSFSNHYPGWSVGMNLEIPFFGNQRAHNEFSAQKLRVSQADLDMDSARNRLSNTLRTRWEQLQRSFDEASQLKLHVRLLEELLESERLDYQLGRGHLRNLLDREDNLNEGRHRYVESTTRLELARAALLLVDGSLLTEYGIEVTQ